MKNGMLIWNIVLSLLVAVLVVLHFSSKNGSKSGTKSANHDTAHKDGRFRMAYFEMDSVAANFELVKDLKSELAKKEESISSEMTSRAKTLQQKYDFYKQKAMAGALSQEQSEAASQEMKNMDDENKLRKQDLDQEYNNFMITKQNEIKSKIQSFIKEYNKTKNYSYIVSDDPGLFYYQDTACNITKDVIQGLNEMYVPKKKAK